MNKQIDTILTTEMDRRDFLKHVGLAIIAVMGISGLISTLGKFGQPAQARQQTNRGYGRNTYGG